VTGKASTLPNWALTLHGLSGGLPGGRVAARARRRRRGARAAGRRRRGWGSGRCARLRAGGWAARQPGEGLLVERLGCLQPVLLLKARDRRPGVGVHHAVDRPIIKTRCAQLLLRASDLFVGVVGSLRLTE